MHGTPGITTEGSTDEDPPSESLAVIGRTRLPQCSSPSFNLNMGRSYISHIHDALFCRYRDIGMHDHVSSIAIVVEVLCCKKSGGSPVATAPLGNARPSPTELHDSVGTRCVRMGGPEANIRPGSLPPPERIKEADPAEFSPDRPH